MISTLVPFLVSDEGTKKMSKALRKYIKKTMWGVKFTLNGNIIYFQRITPEMLKITAGTLLLKKEIVVMMTGSGELVIEFVNKDGNCLVQYEMDVEKFNTVTAREILRDVKWN